MHTNRNAHREVQRGFRQWGAVFIAVLFMALTAARLAQAQPPAPVAPTTESIPMALEDLSVPADALRGERSKTKTKLDASLAEVSAIAQDPNATVGPLAASIGFAVEADRIQIHVVTSPAMFQDAMAAIADSSGIVTAVSADQSLIQSWLPINELERLSSNEAILFVRRPEPAHMLEDPQAAAAETEGLSVINGLAWHDANIKGAGVKIAIVDGGFMGYSELLGSDLPADVIVRNFVDGADINDVEGTTKHGTGCAEIIHDIAPEAEIYLVRVATSLDLAEAVAWLIEEEVDIISSSIGWFALTPGDGTGIFADLVNQTRAAGIVWTTAAGNERERHWGGPFADQDGDTIHDFNGKEINCFSVEEGTCAALGPGYLVQAYLRWNDWTNVNQDYDLFLLRWNGSGWEVVTQSNNSQNGSPGQSPVEYAFTITAGEATAYGVAILREDANGDANFELYVPDLLPLDENLPARSIVNLGDAPDAITVAALDVTTPFPQEIYSSEGPTNGPGGAATGGFMKPDLAAFANVSTVSYGPGIFNGTSSATPHVAGAAALVLSVNPSFSADAIQAYLETSAIDMGTPGNDNRFGHGRLYLGEPYTETIASQVRLPIVRNFAGNASNDCQPDPAGESDNFDDAITICSGQTVTGSVDSVTDIDDVYRILASGGNVLEMTLAGTGGDVDLYFYAPHATDITSDLWIARSVREGNAETMRFYVPETAFWYVDVYAHAGSPDYTLTVRETANNGFYGCIPDAGLPGDNIDDARLVCSGQPLSGVVDEANIDDVYAISIPAGWYTSIQLAGTGGNSDLALFEPGAADIFTDIPLVFSAGPGNDEGIYGIPGSAGEYYVDVYSAAGSVVYDLWIYVTDVGFNAALSDDEQHRQGEKAERGLRSVDTASRQGR